MRYSVLARPGYHGRDLKNDRRGDEHGHDSEPHLNGRHMGFDRTARLGRGARWGRSLRRLPKHPNPTPRRLKSRPSCPSAIVMEIPWAHAASQYISMA